MNTRLSERILAANRSLIIDGTLDAVRDFFTSDYVAHVTGEDMRLGHDGVLRILDMYRRAFTDMTVEVEILVESEPRVSWQRIFRAVHTGTFKGFPGTGRETVWRDMITSQFRDRLIAEDWIITDLAERLLLARR